MQKTLRFENRYRNVWLELTVKGTNKIDVDAVVKDIRNYARSNPTWINELFELAEERERVEEKEGGE